MGIQMEGSCDMAKLNEWLSKLLQVRSMELALTRPSETPPPPTEALKACSLYVPRAAQN